MIDQQIVQVLYTQSVLIIDSTSITQKIIEKKTAHHRLKFRKYQEILSCNRISLIALTTKQKA